MAVRKEAREPKSWPLGSFPGVPQPEGPVMLERQRMKSQEPFFQKKSKEHTWTGRGAEATLHRRNRAVGEALAEPSSSTSSLFSSFSPERSSRFCPRSSSAPELDGPTKPTSSLVSLYPELAYLERDPPEFAVQQQQEAQRQAKRLLRFTYRDSVENVVPFAFQRRHEFPPRLTAYEVPPRLRLDGNYDGERAWEQKPLPRMVYAKPPIPAKRPDGIGTSSTSRSLALEGSADSAASRGFAPHGEEGVLCRNWSIQAAAGSPKASLQSAASADGLALRDPPAAASTGGLRAVPGDPEAERRKEARQTMKLFGRMGQGAPYTFSQIQREVEAKAHFREARDMRAVSSTGHTGPARPRRKLIFAPERSSKKSAKDQQRPTSRPDANTSASSSSVQTSKAAAPAPRPEAPVSSPSWSPPTRTPPAPLALLPSPTVIPEKPPDEEAEEKDISLLGSARTGASFEEEVADAVATNLPS